VGDNASLDSIQGALTLHGQTANSITVFDDLMNAAVQTYTLSSNTLKRTGMADITYDGLDQVALFGGTANDTFNVPSTLATTPVSIISSGGNDIFNVSATVKNLSTSTGE
jgi:hypothetical protein